MDFLKFYTRTFFLLPLIFPQELMSLCSVLKILKQNFEHDSLHIHLKRKTSDRHRMQRIFFFFFHFICKFEYNSENTSH